MTKKQWLWCMGIAVLTLTTAQIVYSADLIIVTPRGFKPGQAISISFSYTPYGSISKVSASCNVFSTVESAPLGAKDLKQEFAGSVNVGTVTKVATKQYKCDQTWTVPQDFDTKRNIFFEIDVRDVTNIPDEAVAFMVSNRYLYYCSRGNPKAQICSI